MLDCPQRIDGLGNRQQRRPSPRRAAKPSLRRHAGAFALAALLAVTLVAVGSPPWVMYPVAAWALALALHAIFAMRRQSTSDSQSGGNP